MRQLIIFGLVIFFIAGAATRFADRFNGTKVAAKPAATIAVAPAPAPVTAGPRSVTIRKDDHGHFRISGAIDGRRMGFMIDTGATVVALREGDAARIGIHPARRDYTAQVNTANGSVRAARTQLAAIEVGGIMVRNVDALIMPDEALGENLLGLSFLSRLRRWEYGSGRLVLEE